VEIVYQLMGHLFSGVGVCLLAIMCGAAFLFFGIRLYRIFAVFTGMVVGGLLGSMVSQILINQYAASAPEMAHKLQILPPLAGAILCGLLAVTLSRMALGILIGAGGFYAAFQIGSEWGVLTGLGAAICAYIVLSLLAVIFFNHIIILTSSVFGTAILIAGLLNFLFLTRQALFTRLVGNYKLSLIALTAVLLIIGIFYQLELERQKRKVQVRS
jgi:hypothetical protein